MGIKGLLRAIKDTATQCHISAFRGQRVAVDGFAWLHRSVYSCATELALGTPTDKHIVFLMRYTSILRQNGVIPVIIFDGAEFPLKSDTNAKRKT